MTAAGGQSPRAVVTALGLVQILAWGSSFHFPAVFAGPIVAQTGWPLPLVVGGVSLGLLVGGLISPQVGALIARHGGRPLLAASSLLFAAGLAGIGFAASLPAYLIAWAVVGLGMGTGLYDAAFAALGRRYGSKARTAIATLTLFGGFASTVCWPLSAWLLETIGWRSACFVYAALHLVLALPLHLLAMRGEPTATPGVAQGASDHADTAASLTGAHRRAVMAALAAVLSIAAGIGSMVAVYLLVFLQAGGITFAAAVSLGMLFGPAQVGARLVERLFGQSYHPLWTLAASIVLMLAGLLLLFLLAQAAHTELWLVALAIILYAAGYGISLIARGTVPLAIFGAATYPLVIGRLALPSLIVQALAPTLGAIMIAHFGSLETIAMLAALAAVNIAFMIVLWRLAAASRNA